MIEVLAVEVSGADGATPARPAAGPGGTAAAAPGAGSSPRRWVVVDTFGANQIARVEPFDAIELELGLLWEDGTWRHVQAMTSTNAITRSTNTWAAPPVPCEDRDMTSPRPGVLRTPDDRFGELPDYSYQPRYVESLAGFEGLRMHYVDEGDPASPVTFLCLHGQPTWSYLYRRMLPVFMASGARVVAPDLYGFGRSDKPTDETWYTFTRHREALLAFVRHLNLEHITLVCQDWGGILGLTLPMEAPARYERLIVMNTVLATGRFPLGEGFLAWRAWVNANPDFAVGRLMRRACPSLSEAEAAAYDAPFPSAEYKAGARRFPNLVCDHPGADGAEPSRQAARWWQREWRGRSFMAIGMQDVVIPPTAMHWLRQVVRGCPAPLELANVGHFVQEHGEAVASAALAHFAVGTEETRTSTRS